MGVVGIQVVLIFETEEGIVDIYDETADFERMECDEDYREDVYNRAIRKALETLPKNICQKVIDTDISDFWETSF